MMKYETPGGCRITRILFGRCNVYMLDNGIRRILIDTGAGMDGRRLLNRLRASGKPDAVILTHTHFDHTGNAGLIEALCSPDFIVHESEREYLETGVSPLPEGSYRFTGFLVRLGRERVNDLFKVKGVSAGRAFNDRFDLKPLGFNACIIHTPGHSRGSCSVIVEDRVAIVGDTMVGYPHFYFPPFADDPAGVSRSWEKLIATGCRVFLPAHGFPVSIGNLKRASARYCQRH